LTTVGESIVGRAAVGTAVLTALLFGASVAGIAEFNSAVVTIFLIDAVAAVGLGVFMGNSGILSFGHPGFMALGAYVSGILSMNPTLRKAVLTTFPSALSGLTLPFWAGVCVALGCVALSAIITGLAVVRLPRDAAAIATLGVLVIVNVVLLNATSITNGAQPLYGVALKVGWHGAFVVAVISVAIARLFRESSAGLELRATREDAVAAESLGINVRRRRLQAWVLSAIISGASGLLLGHFLGAFSPAQFYLTLTITIVAMVIVGGESTVSGAVIGAILVTVVLQVLGNIESGSNIGPLHIPALLGLPTLGLSVVLILTVYFKREGLCGRQELELAVGGWIRRIGSNQHRGDSPDLAEGLGTGAPNDVSVADRSRV
jgi:branched-chain amino acid transport system ATP-binding protein/branched-chain amino acid transport system permease protein